MMSNLDPDRRYIQETTNIGCTNECLLTIGFISVFYLFSG